MDDLKAKVRAAILAEFGDVVGAPEKADEAASVIMKHISTDRLVPIQPMPVRGPKP